MLIYSSVDQKTLRKKNFFENFEKIFFFFQRKIFKKLLSEGIYVIDPKTDEKRETVKSKECGKIAFKDSLLVRWLLPIPGKKTKPLKNSSFCCTKINFKPRKEENFPIPKKNPKIGY